MLKRNVSQITNFITLGLIALTIFIYFPPYAHAFVGDDYVQLDYILEFVSQPWTAFQVFNPFWIGWYYRPLQNLWFLGSRLLFDFNPFGYYWLGLLVHGLVVALVYRVARQMGIRPFFALLTAALFAIHKHHLDVITWISAIAIVMVALFSLAALTTYLRFLRSGDSNRSSRALAFSLLFIVLALLSHEESILLLPLLIWWRLSVGGEAGTTSLRFPELAARLRSRLGEVTRGEWIVWGVAALLTAVYVTLQVTRPNLTISLQETSSSQWWAGLAPAQLARFTAETVGKYLPFALAQPVLAQDSFVVALITLVLLLAWLWYGDGITRFGLLWALLHLALIYWALWTQKPDLYAGRHIYNSWIGVVLAIGASLQRLQTAWRQQIRKRQHRERFDWYSEAAATILVVAVLAIGVRSTRQVQARWVANAAEEEAARQQLQEMVPTINDDTHLFAVRFPITPDFLRSVTQVWYERKETLLQPFGPLTRLQEYGQATPGFYLLNWESESSRLSNLMPELQARAHTIFLWRNKPRYETVSEAGALVQVEPEEKQTMSVVGPINERRFALTMGAAANGEWRAAVYEEAIPNEGNTAVYLETAVRRAPAEEDPTPLQARIRLSVGNDTEILYETTIPATDAAWHEVSIPLREYAGRGATIRLEISGGGTAYWANPRLGLDG